MVFGLFSRRTQSQSQPQSVEGPESSPRHAQDPVTSPRVQFQQLRTPSPSVDLNSIGKANSSPLAGLAAQVQGSPVPCPPVTPSPPPEELVTDPTELHSLLQTIPAKTLHDYTLAHLLPSAHPMPSSSTNQPIRPPSPRTLTVLTSFFSTLTPPPVLHCVRCHKSYTEIENSDRSCRVPHDDESAVVERVGYGAGSGANYETLWGCCGRTVEGDGDMGPPDGWCYEGKHTTDIKRARFRADSTPNGDKLVSCAAKRCYTTSPKSVRSPSPSKSVLSGRSGASGSARKRTRPAELEADERQRYQGDEDERPEESSKTTRGETTVKGRGRKRTKVEEVKDDHAMDVDVDSGNEETRGRSRATSRAKPVSTVKPMSKVASASASTTSRTKPKSKVAAASQPATSPERTPPPSNKLAQRPKSLSRATSLKQSKASQNEEDDKDYPCTRSRSRSRVRPGVDTSVNTARGKMKGRQGNATGQRGRTKRLAEVVASSVDGEGFEVLI